MQKILVICLVWCMILYPVCEGGDCTNGLSKRDEKSEQLKPKDYPYFIDAVEQSKRLAWEDGDLKLRARLHEEVFYEKEPMYRNYWWVMTFISFLGASCIASTIKERFKD